ncbi:unnamed protein product [Prorocentrum cordatum]|uniref:Uncharacterized protein n=1 Tax=Prorocentrum cordatum TaxID=2364126 RepID=A0ABN9WVC5_9DINO|nr:unnamed protein product [Polarella glacialis]
MAVLLMGGVVPEVYCSHHVEMQMFAHEHVPFAPVCHFGLFMYNIIAKWPASRWGTLNAAPTLVFAKDHLGTSNEERLRRVPSGSHDVFKPEHASQAERREVRLKRFGVDSDATKALPDVQGANVDEARNAAGWAWDDLLQQSKGCCGCEAFVGHSKARICEQPWRSGRKGNRDEALERLRKYAAPPPSAGAVAPTAQQADTFDKLKKVRGTATQDWQTLLAKEARVRAARQHLAGFETIQDLMEELEVDGEDANADCQRFMKDLEQYQREGKGTLQDVETTRRPFGDLVKAYGVMEDRSGMQGDGKSEGPSPPRPDEGTSAASAAAPEPPAAEKKATAGDKHPVGLNPTAEDRVGAAGRRAPPGAARRRSAAHWPAYCPASRAVLSQKVGCRQH